MSGRRIREHQEEVRFCSRCSESKSQDEFSPGHSWCRPCKSSYEKTRSRNQEQRREYRSRNGLGQWGYDLQKVYNISVERYMEISAAQSDGCAVCGITAEEAGKRLSVDHDHSCCPGSGSCGRCVRGLLCQRCNLLLGHAGDSIEYLRDLASYLDSNPWLRRSDTC